MAFLRYVINSSAADNGTTINAVFDDIKNWVDGTHTATSDFSSTYCNTAASEIQGTIPANVYFDVSKNSNTSSSSDSYLRFAKYHSDWSSYNSSHPADKMFLYWSATGSYGFRLRTGNRSNGNLLPYPSTNYYQSAFTSSSYKTDFRPAYTTIFIWLEEDYMAIQAVESNYNYSIFIGSFDQPRSEYAEYAFDQDSDFPCAVTVSALCHTSYNNTVNSSYNSIEVSTHDYADELGGNRAYPGNYNAGYSYFSGFAFNEGYEMFTINPAPGCTVDQTPISGGVGHQLIPVFSSNRGGGSSVGNYPIIARLKGLYRTSDEFASTGTSITYGGNNYRVCMMHKCGSTLGDAQNVINACYLLPVT